MRYRILSRGHSAFTLVELLVVMSIIAALAGLLFPVAGGVNMQVRKVKTKTLFASIKMGLDQYYTEYQRMPQLSGAGGGGDISFQSDEPMGRELLSAITGDVDDDVGKRLNPKTISFCEFSEKQMKDNDSRGLGGYLVDGFGNPFYMIMDFDYDGKIDRNAITQIPSRFQPKGDVKGVFAAWSRGPAKSVGEMNTSDLVASWK
ncbi:MAG: type II secretion system protein [Verrucomicrobiae bacterium]|nr:type II secretion system protein [Verrucomicrobiae bacterium]